ncbi:MULTISPECIES: carboxymuconolactone decarboxylase family protein [Xenorhabdus]|uniref:Carboxymuconolactone decarboxylase family protein n=3 Tax=Xenorhabdus TaxID=626 RepID=A0A0B6XGC0_XENBV|nr:MULTISPECIES: carboxymuconolactone decarboxylase family protein [Xenorhabdus]MCP9267344.1 carboxymuconolactone decarboxylase family protein [Xenorhabdus bovienii subsp. africana]MDC9622881.1 carboxymuconolactone decarboxylase family protein [Xenorhabdus aichiensis]MDE1473107.1 carboxymuconolactone decarboxylase family protein [Xenorhabdus bovienii]MDE1479328.1 carboxymuconolactone decarboxylase family protein [Xenorhabdus bovienii]MDE1482015.1 carboxymuconolactone decarboxylase family prote
MNYAKISPKIMNPLYKCYDEIQKCELDQSLILLVEMRTSQINGCAYCCRLHAEMGRKLGIEEEKLDKLPGWFNSRIYNQKEVLALEWCEALTIGLRDKDLNDLRERLEELFSEKELVDLTSAISVMNALNRMAISIGDNN